jgi:CRISPR-associated protein Csd1
VLLQKLREYSERLDLPPQLYAEGAVRYIIELDKDGRFLGLTDTADSANARTRRGIRRLVPQIQRTVAIKPLLLADKADYVLGYGAEGRSANRVADAHRAFVDIVERCRIATGEPALDAVSRFLRDDALSKVDLGSSFDPGGVITFRVDGTFVVDLPKVQAFWAEEHTLDSDAGAHTMQCLVCGNERPVLDRLQAKLKGVPGGQTSGTSIISANAEAFESYGLEASLIAPTCADCGERFTKALNELLGGEGSSLRMGGSAFAFWTREPTQFDFFSFMDEPQPEQVRALIESVRTGRQAPYMDEARQNRFYATALSGSGGRAVVREWIDVTVPEAQESLGRWFRRQAIVDAASGELRYFSLRSLAGATVRDLRDVSPPTSRSLLRAALAGTPLPLDLLFAAVRRTRAEQRVTAPQAALIKLVLASLPGRTEEEQMVELQPEHPSRGYQCGRLLAVLESVQRAALPGIKAGIVDRFYGSASSSPGGVFPRLVRGAQPHLGKLERDRKAAHVALQQRLEEVLGHLPEFPKVLSLEEQGLFALGYYHQRAADAARRREAAERRRAGVASTEDERDAALGEALAEDEA